MGFLKGLGKVALGIMESGKSVIVSDGATRFCPKCGMPTQGICTSCASKKASKLISEGINDIKAADEKIYIDAEKQGYIKASKEYENAFKEIQTKYIQAKLRFEKTIREKDLYSEQLISLHEQLVLARESLELEFEKRSKKVAEENNVSAETVKNTISTNAFGSNNGIDLISLLHGYREKKLREAERKGYNRAKSEYDIKINALKREFKELQNMSNLKIGELYELISDVLIAISEERMKIATLTIVE